MVRFSINPLTQEIKQHKTTKAARRYLSSVLADLKEEYTNPSLLNKKWIFTTKERAEVSLGLRLPSPTFTVYDYNRAEFIRFDNFRELRKYRREVGKEFTEVFTTEQDLIDFKEQLDIPADEEGEEDKSEEEEIVYLKWRTRKTTFYAYSPTADNSDIEDVKKEVYKIFPFLQKVIPVEDVRLIEGDSDRWDNKVILIDDNGFNREYDLDTHQRTRELKNPPEYDAPDPSYFK